MELRQNCGEMSLVKKISRLTLKVDLASDLACVIGSVSNEVSRTGSGSRKDRALDSETLSENGQSWFGFLMIFFFSSSKKILGKNLDLATTASLQILSGHSHSSHYSSLYVTGNGTLNFGHPFVFCCLLNSFRF